MAEEQKKNKVSSDINETFAPRIAEHMMDWLITFFNIETLRNQQDFIQAISIPISYITSRLLPDSSMLSLVLSDMLGRVDKVAAARVKDWDTAKSRLYQDRLKAANKANRNKRPQEPYQEAQDVADADYEKFKGYLTYRNREESFEKLKVTMKNAFGDRGEKIIEKLRSIQTLKDFHDQLKTWGNEAKNKLKNYDFEADMTDTKSTLRNRLTGRR